MALLDLDLRRPSLSRVLGVEVPHGLEEVLRGDAPLDAARVQFEQPPLDENTKCFVTGERATAWVVWGRSY